MKTDVIPALDRLMAIEAIRQLKARYFRCLDGQNWRDLATVFAIDAVFDMRTETEALRARGMVLPVGAGYSAGRDAIVASMSRGLEHVVSVHQGHMCEIEVLSANDARGTWSMEDILRMPDQAPVAEIRGYGRYYERYRLGQDGWQIAYLTFTRTLRYVQARDGSVTVDSQIAPALDI